LLGPYNLLNVHPSLLLELAPSWTLGLDSVFFWRQSTGDGVYDNAGNLLRSGAGSGARDIGTQFDVTLTFAPDRTFETTIGWSTFLAGDFLRDTGSDDTVHFAYAEATFVF
jgi:hypothetical protein